MKLKKNFIAITGILTIILSPSAFASSFDRPIPQGAEVIDYRPGATGVLIRVTGENAYEIARSLVTQGADVSQACTVELDECMFIVLKTGRLIPTKSFQVPDSTQRIGE